MSSFINPTNPTQGPGAGAAGQVGGFFQMGEVDGIGGQNNYSPGAVQRAIDQLMEACGPHMGEFQVEYLMYLMQSYGNQDVGVDATNQTDMNQYFGDVQNLWGALYAGNVGASSDLPTITGISYNGTAVTGSPGNVFADDLYAIRYAIENDPFFKNSQGGQQMEQQLLGALNEINSISNQVSAGPGVDKIWEMWQQYNGEQGSSTVSTSGSPDAMDSMMRELGQLNQDVTGVSQSIGTQFQSDSNNQQTESAALNNYLQMLYKMNQVLIQNMQSSSS